jgi:ABC-type uncharacterized transport system permease subunit
MLEVIIAYIGLTFLWAYLYSKSPEPSTISGIAFRILYLGLTLFTVYELLSILVIHAQTSNLPNSVINLVVGYMSVMNYVIFLIFVLIFIFLLINNILPLFKKEEE